VPAGLVEEGGMSDSDDGDDLPQVNVSLVEWPR
jgi:hypothetical protein